MPYRGEAPAYADLMAGQLQVVVGNIAATSSLVAGGKLRALAVTGKERSKLMPDVPTAAEAGFPNFENIGWFGLLAPAGTPKEVVDKIWQDTAKVLAQGDVKDRLATQGMVPIGNAPGDFTQAIGKEAKEWAVVVEEPQAGGAVMGVATALEVDLGAVEEAAKDALHPRPEGAAARRQGRPRAPRGERDRRDREAGAGDDDDQHRHRRGHRQPALPGHRRADLQRRRSAAASRSTAMR